MTATLISGPRTRSLKRDKEGHRDYEVSHIVKTDDILDGPTIVMDTPGLPLVGLAVWNFGNDFDIWATCWPTMSITPHNEKKGESTKYWLVSQKFSTKPLTRCQDQPIENPLDEPQKVSGSFVRGTIEATEDRFGQSIHTSSWEPVRGSQVEFDDYNPSVIIEQNKLNLELELFTGMVNKVNDAPLWGLPARTIKLSGAPWSRKILGQCGYYFARRFEFQINKKTFDRPDIIDEGTKALGSWVVSDPGPPVVASWVVAGDINNPGDYNRYQGKDGNVARVLLNGFGEPLEDGANPKVIPMGTVEYYEETNLLLLGIPTDLEAT